MAVIKAACQLQDSTNQSTRNPSHYQFKSLSSFSSAAAATATHPSLCINRPHCRNPLKASKIDFHYRMTLNQSQLKFCCSCWCAWAIFCWFVQGQLSNADCGLSAKQSEVLSKWTGCRPTCFSWTGYKFLNKIPAEEYLKVYDFISLVLSFFFWKSAGGFQVCRGGNEQRKRLLSGVTQSFKHWFKSFFLGWILSKGQKKKRMFRAWIPGMVR